MTVHEWRHRTGPCTLPHQLTRLSDSGRLTRRFIDRGFFLGKHGMLFEHVSRVDISLISVHSFVFIRAVTEWNFLYKIADYFLFHKICLKHANEYRKCSTKFSHGYEVLIVNRSFMKSSGYNNDKGEQKIRTIKLCKKTEGRYRLVRSK